MASHDSQISETNIAQNIAALYGMSSLDRFKVWKDKSYFFSASHQSFLAYKKINNYVIVLGDPLGPQHERAQLLEDFKQYCKEKLLGLALFECSENYLEDYKEQGLHQLKMGDEAIIDLEAFNLDGKKKRRLRCDRNRLEKHGFYAVSYKAHTWDHIYEEVKAVSDEWLQQPGRKEMSFALGDFEENYMKSTEIYVIKDKDHQIVAFLNLVPSGEKGEMVVDLMRHIKGIEHGIMDYLFIKTFLGLKNEGWKKISIGLAPMSGFSKDEEASNLEKFVHASFKRLNFLFSYEGLRTYKDKFATQWQPRYLVFQNMHDLPLLALAIYQVFQAPIQKPQNILTTVS